MVLAQTQKYHRELTHFSAHQVEVDRLGVRKAVCQVVRLFWRFSSSDPPDKPKLAHCLRPGYFEKPINMYDCEYYSPSRQPHLRSIPSCIAVHACCMAGSLAGQTAQKLRGVSRLPALCRVCRVRFGTADPQDVPSWGATKPWTHSKLGWPRNPVTHTIMGGNHETLGPTTTHIYIYLYMYIYI